MVDRMEYLRRCVAAYELAIEGDWHYQNRDFHRVVLQDAKHVLGLCPPATIRGKRHSPATAAAEVSRELIIIQLSRRSVKVISGLAARRAAAEAVGVPYKDFIKGCMYRPTYA